MIQLSDINKGYQTGEQTVNALENITLSIPNGAFTIILGTSGSGKSTLLNLLGGMDLPSSGRVTVNGQVIDQFSHKQLSDYRSRMIGFVFQFYNLIPSLTALENVALASQLTGRAHHATDYLTAVGLADRRDNFPNQLSGGEMQRVSIARALAKDPAVVLCDEPTGALDTQTGLKTVDLLQQTAHQHNKAVIMVTHNETFAPLGDRVIRLVDGRIASIVDNDRPATIEEVKEL